MTVEQNMGFALELAGTKKPEIKRKVDEAAAILGLGPLLQRKPAQLSGGQRQRVAMGRAIVRDPKVFLFDEPLSNLDAKLRVQMRGEIKGLHQRLSTTIVYVTHDQIEAMTMADKIVVMNAGRVEQMGAPLDLYDRPDNIFVAGFLGSPAMNFLAGKAGADGRGVQLADGSRIEVRPFGGSLAGEDIIFGIRPEHIKLAEAGGVAAEVLIVEPTGAETHLTVRIGGQDVVCVLNDRVDASAGQVIQLSLASERAMFFNPESGNRLTP
jgi:multiple sugar transport system ATP-binding protein